MPTAFPFSKAFSAEPGTAIGRSRIAPATTTAVPSVASEADSIGFSSSEGPAALWSFAIDSNSAVRQSLNSKQPGSSERPCLPNWSQLSAEWRWSAPNAILT